MLRAAIVGLGWWGRTITDRMAASEEMRITRAVDLWPANHADYSARHGIPVGASYDEVLADPAIDAVILCTPNSLHTPQVAAAARAGKHVFCEKPLALNAAEARASVEICRAHGVQLGIGHERRFETAMLEIERMVRAGELGTIMHAEANFSHDKLINVPPTDWRRRADESPAAGMTAMGIHLSDAFVNLFGAATEVQAQTAARVLPGENGDVVSALIRFASGPTAYLNAVLYTPLYLRLAIFGTGAWAEYRNETHPDTPGPATLTIQRTGAAPEVHRHEWTDSVRANLDLFARAATGRGSYPFTDVQKIGNIAVLEAIVRSAATGECVRI
ncbi:MAG: Gfo/Idh/MocA family protein [Gemmobacter sp.]